MWKRNEQHGWGTFSDGFARTGLQLKVMNAESGPSAVMARALWHTGDTPGYVRLNCLNIK